MKWPQMTMDEYAAFYKDNGARLCQSGNTWWISVGPLFFRPLFPFLKIATDRRVYPLSSFWGGVQHLVPDPAQANCAMSFFVYEDLQKYDMSILKHQCRSNVRSGLKRFTARRITDLSEFVRQAHPIYLEFYQRTRYSFKKDRIYRHVFEKWAQTLFKNPKIAIIGAYHDNNLAAVDISYRIENVIVDATFFSGTAYLKLHVREFMMHTLRQAAAMTDATCYYLGAPLQQSRPR